MFNVILRYLHENNNNKKMAINSYILRDENNVNIVDRRITEYKFLIALVIFTGINNLLHDSVVLVDV